MRVYISGPMTGIPGYNIPVFCAAAKKLRAVGHFVINPAELSSIFGTPDEINNWYTFPRSPEGTSRNRERFDAMMDADLAAVRSCDAIYLLRGWEKSRGAKKELAEAIAHGLRVMQEGGEE